MNKPVTITATVAVWVSSGYSQRDLMKALELGDSVGAINALSIYGPVEKKTFGDDCIRVGEADVTVRLISRDEQTALMVQTLQAKLDEERGKWLERQQAILAEIQKLQALEYVAPDHPSADEVIAERDLERAQEAAQALAESREAA